MKLNKFKINIFTYPYAITNSLTIVMYHRYHIPSIFVLKGDLINDIFEIRTFEKLSNSAKTAVKKYKSKADYVLKGSVSLPAEVYPLFISYLDTINRKVSYKYFIDVEKEVILESSLIFEYLKLYGKYHGQKEKVFGQKNSQGHFKEGAYLDESKLHWKV